ncbi:MAG: roadblock/LC7 domain-containing protein [Promethearchaeota archaeon]
MCRKCGALLPVSSKTQRLRVQLTETKKAKKHKKKDMDLQEIPKENEPIEQIIKESEVVDKVKEEIKITQYESNSETKSSLIKEDKEEILKEITPQPYKSSIIGSDTKVLPKKEANSSLIKQKQLEKDMTEVLSFLSKKITVKKLEIPESKVEKEPEKKIPPASMNEILSQLLKLDLHIEASAIIKSDGTILASALSDRISDTLFATIGQTLNQIGTDIINGLSAGSLKSISVKGSKGVLDLAPIDKNSSSIKDMILVIFSHPKVKSGIISFAANIVKEQLIEYLGLKS